MTEIWCDVISDEADLVAILKHNLRLTPYDVSAATVVLLTWPIATGGIRGQLPQFCCVQIHFF